MTTAVDTNVLLRVFVDDGAVQHGMARRFVAERGSEGILLSPLVLAEFVRVMRRNLKRPLDEVVTLLDRILEAPEFVVAQADAVEAALDVYRRGGTEFSDCLIVASARLAGAADVFTFDRDAAGHIPGAVLLELQGG